MSHREVADVLVIGSGAAGASVVKRLSEHGAKVVCLERGDWRQRADYPTAGSNYEGQFRRSQFSFNPNVRKRREDYPVVSAGQNPPDIEMVNAVGGTTVVWNCQCLRFHPSDFQARAVDGVARDWPIRYQDLEPFYNQYDREVGVSGLAGDPANPKRSLPLPPLPLGDAGRIAGKAFNKLGWHWWIFPTGILSRPYDGRPACDLNGRGWYGCGVTAKAGTDVTHWPRALRKGAILKTGAHVSRLTIDAHGRVRGALYFDQHGNQHEQLARVVVVCANGIGTPRLLLVSKSKEFPDGLANSSGLVGKGLMLHVWRSLRGIVPECIDSYLHPVYNPVFSHQFYETASRRGFVRGYTMYVSGTGGPLSTALRVKAPWGADHHKVMRHNFPHLLSVGIIGEDLPDESNGVELDSNLKDSDGIPAPRVVYSFSENSRKMLDHAAARARELLEAAGASEIADEGVWPGTSHFMGTARMGDDSRTSVVNKWHQAHDVKNLFLVDGSSFVTGGAVGPTPTIGALGLRCADGIWERRREWV